MSDMTYWCESCARKNNCYTIRSKPKCFTPITSNDRTADRKTEPQTEDKCKGCIYANGDSLMACVSCQGKVPYDGYDFMDEPQTDCSWK